MRDMCDPYGKNLTLGHTQRLKEVVRFVRCAKNAPQKLKNMQVRRGYQKKNVYCVESLRFGR